MDELLASSLTPEICHIVVAIQLSGLSICPCIDARPSREHTENTVSRAPYKNPLWKRCEKLGAPSSSRARHCESLTLHQHPRRQVVAEDVACGA